MCFSKRTFSKANKSGFTKLCNIETILSIQADGLMANWL